MRTKSTRQPYLEIRRESSVKIVKEHRKKYERIDGILRENPAILNRLHADLEKTLSSSDKGRRSVYTSEEILRCLIVMFLEGASYRDVVIRIEESEFLRNFAGLGWKPMMDFSFLSRAFACVPPETWEFVNEKFGQYARKTEKITGQSLRVDTTVSETNIHYPTDASLLWDGYRGLARLLDAVRQDPSVTRSYRFHEEKTKRLVLWIGRGNRSTNKKKQRQVKSLYRKLLKNVKRLVELAEEVAPQLSEFSPEKKALLEYAKLTRRVMHQTEKRVFEGIHLPAEEKVLSLYEPHTELIKRGKTAKPNEFGHLVLIGQSREKFITQYQVLEKQTSENQLVDKILKRHEKQFEQLPKVLAADKGFYESMEKINELRKKIQVVSIGKKGKRDAREARREKTKGFKEGQRFRAGIEGSISVLKRAFGLARPLFKGFRNYASGVGCTVFCYNLVLLARM
jgi:IS5 family transposase